MGHTLLCVLGLFLLNTLLYGHAEGQDDDQEKSADDSVGTGPTGAVAILEVPDFTLFGGDSVTLRCRHRTPENEMKASFIKDGSPLKMETNHPSLSLVEVTINPVSVSDGGTYTCKFDDGAESEERELKVEARRREVTLTAGNTIIPAGGSVTLSCSVEKPAGFRYLWYRLTSDSTEVNESDRVISHGGKYTCRGWRSEDGVFTPESDAVTIQETVSNKVSVILQPNWPQIFSGETITLRCEIQAGGDTKWTYEWTPAKLNRPPTDNEYRISSATVSHSGDYSCKGRRDSYSSTEWSDVIKLTVSSQRPKAQLRADRRTIPAGGSVTLSCSVNPSSGWKYFWYRGEKTSEPLNTQDAVFISNGQISVSQGGLYWCRGGRGDPVYYTEHSNAIVTNRAVVTLQPNWSEIYSGETISLRCEIKEGGDTEWEYEWKTSSSYKPQKQHEYIIGNASSHNGEYSCRGKPKSEKSSTEWSDAFTLKLSDKPQSVLTVSPSWLSPGASVTLSCSVKDPSAGWRFFWYKAVPKLSGSSYSYKLLPGSSNGTEQDSYIVHGQTHTAGYKCRAGRGDPVYYTDGSKPKFVWSGDFHPAASLTVSPDRVQHFTEESVSLSCEGNSTKWRVRRFSKSGHLTHCSSWGTMTGSTCNTNKSQYIDGVYWCESETGQFSNAVNITGQNSDLILVSPVHPVAEGDSVTLGCKLKTENVLSNVNFYKNDKLIQSDTRGELTIPAVSKSDEGFYKCEGKYSPHQGSRSSPKSWISVKSSRSAFPVLLIVGLVVGILLIVPLALLLCLYKQSKDTCFHRLIQSQRTNQSSATVHTVNQYESLQQVYSTLHHGDVCVYETISVSGNTGSGEGVDEYINVSSEIQLEGLGNMSISDDPVESSDFYNANPDSTEGP